MNKKTKIIFIFFCSIFGIIKIFADIIYNNGDVDGNGIINRNDAVAIANYIIGNFDSDFNLDEADVNGDGQIRINDVVLILLEKAQKPASFSFNVSSIGLANDNTLDIKAKYLNNSENVSLTWRSSNDEVASVTNDGKITTKKGGVTDIIVSDEYNREAKMQVIVFNYQIYDSYESDTLKYWIERPNSNYIISRIWVEDAYNQMRVAITNEVNSNITPVKTWESSFQSQYDRANEINQCINDPNRTYHMYNVMDSDVLLNNEISKKNYNNKGLYVVNCSPMVSTYWSTSAPCDWFGTATIPLVINEGTVIRDSTDGALFSNRSVLGLTNNNEIKSYSFKKGDNEDEISKNKATVQKIKEDGVKYTFANFGTLVSDYEVKTSSSSNNIRTSLCQIDEHNYILISSTVSDTSTEIRDNNGISLLKMANDMVEYGCKTGYNFDGGGSQTSYFIKNNNKINYIRPRSYDGRGLADLFYFVEK